jgi:hypothetical protein
MSSILVQEIVEVFLQLLALLGELAASAPDSSPSAGLLGLVSFFFCSAMGPTSWPPRVSRNPG